MPDPKRLDVVINTTAMGDGAQKTESDLARLGQLTKAQQAEARASLREQRSDAAQAALKEIETAEQVRKGLGRTAEAAKETAGSLESLRTAGENTGRVLHGLEEASAGGARGLVGLGNIARGTLGLFRNFATLLTGPFGLALGAAAAGIAYMGKIARENQTYIEKLFTDAKKHSEEYQAKIDALKAASVVSFASQVEDLKKLTAAYDELVKAEDAAAARVAAINAAQRSLEDAKINKAEQEELAGVLDSDQRASISAKYAAQREKTSTARANVDLENEQRAATLRRENAEKAYAGAAVKFNDAQEAATDAQTEVTEATRYATFVAQQNGVNSKLAQEARDAAKVALENLQEQQAHLQEMANELKRIGDAAAAARDNEALVNELAPVKAATISANAAAARAQGITVKVQDDSPSGPSAADQAARDRLAAQRDAQQAELSDLSDQDRRDYTFGGSGDRRAKIASLTTALQDTSAALAAKDDEIASFARATTAQAKKTAEQMRNNRP